MTPVYLPCGAHSIAGIFEPASSTPSGTAVLLVPPFGWDEQTSYRPRRDWSLALASAGFATLRIDLPGTGDSSGTPRDDRLVEAWTDAIAAGIIWLRESGATRVAVIALGAGGLVALQAIGGGAAVDDLVLWGVPASGTALLREIKVFGRLEQSQTGEGPADGLAGELRAGGHVLAPATCAALKEIDSEAPLGKGAPARALILGRDGTGSGRGLADALRANGADVRLDPGRGWGEALARPQSASPAPIFKMVNAWLLETAKPAPGLGGMSSATTAEIGSPGKRIRESAIAFEGAGQQLYAILSEPLDAPVAGTTLILFNAGAIRRIGPNRMWTEAARRWSAAGVPVLRVDVEGIGDAGGDGSRYSEGDESFYTEALLAQARTALDLAAERGCPARFVLGGLCSGAFWAFQTALADPRVSDVIALNPRMLMFDRDIEGYRELRKLQRMLTRQGLRNLLQEPRKARRLARLVRFLIRSPLRAIAPRSTQGDLGAAFTTLEQRGQRLHLAFSGDEPLDQELLEQRRGEEFASSAVGLHQLPFRSHTLKPLAAQQAAHALLDQIVQRSLGA